MENTSKPYLKYVTEEDYSRLRTQTREDLERSAKAGKIPRFLLQDEYVQELCTAGLWLQEEAHKAGASLEQCRDLGFSQGQRCFTRKDPWEISAKTLAAFKAGIATPPKEVLAEQLLQEVGLK